jgi:hypothetical protein
VVARTEQLTNTGLTVIAKELLDDIADRANLPKPAVVEMALSLLADQPGIKALEDLSPMERARQRAAELLSGGAPETDTFGLQAVETA